MLACMQRNTKRTMQAKRKEGSSAPVVFPTLTDRDEDVRSALAEAAASVVQSSVHMDGSRHECLKRFSMHL